MHKCNIGYIKLFQYEPNEQEIATSTRLLDIRLAHKSHL